VIIFDEAETLTDQAQIALRPLLDECPEKILIIFLCNSISRIHKSILHKFLIIPFEAPKTADFNHRMNLILSQSSSKISGLDIQFRRGDIRFFILNPKRFEDCARVWTDIFTAHIDNVNELFERTLQKWTFPDVAMFCMFCASSTGCLNRSALLKLLEISDTDFVKMIPMKQRSKLLSGWFVKFVRQNLEGSLTTS
jgi:DNA polymerase III delta prime subunit